MEDRFHKTIALLGVTSVPTAADDNSIVTTVDMKNGDYTVIASQPVAPSKIGVKVTTVGDVDLAMGTITIVGTDVRNIAITEVVVPISGSTVWTTRYFKTVTTITGAGWTRSADTQEDTIIVGIPATGGIEVHGQSCSFKSVSGAIYVNDKTTATATSASYLMAAGEVLEICVSDVLSFISDGQAATFECIVWEA
jgi:hypothetical protein